MNQPTQEAEVMPDDKALTLRPVQQQAVAEIVPEAKAAAPITAAQAKVEAIAHLTKQAYSQAANLKLTPEESAALQADFPDDAFQFGAGGKENQIYLEHTAIRDRLNKVLGIGQWSIIPRSRWEEEFTMTNKYKQTVHASRIYVEAMLVVRGCFVAEAIGEMVYYKNNDSSNYADAVEGAKTAALRRCAKEFGIGLQAFSKAFANGWWKRKQIAVKSEPVPTPVPSHPKPTPAPAPAPAPAKVVPMPAAAATEKTRDWMIDMLLAKEGQPNRQQATDYFIKIGALIPTETIEDLPLKYVPTNKAALAELADAISGVGPEKPADVPAEPEEPEDDRPHVTGTIERVTVKDGQSKKGPWKLYGICIDGGWLNTFDTKLGEQAQGLQGQEATVYYTESERGKTAVEIK